MNRLQMKAEWNRVQVSVQSHKFSCISLTLQVSEAGVHRPHVGGIHGRSNDGSYSLVLAGGFEDEVVGNFYFHSMQMSPLFILSR